MYILDTTAALGKLAQWCCYTGDMSGMATTFTHINKFLKHWNQIMFARKMPTLHAMPCTAIQ